MTTDLTERGLERLICKALTGDPCDPPSGATVREPPPGYGGVGWSPGNHHDYDRGYCVDVVQLSAFLDTTQPDSAPALRLDEDCPTRRKFLARHHGLINRRCGTFDVLQQRCVAGTAPTTSTASTSAHLGQERGGTSAAASRTACSSAITAAAVQPGLRPSARRSCIEAVHQRPARVSRFELRAQRDAQEPAVGDVIGQYRRRTAIRANRSRSRPWALRGPLRGRSRTNVHVCRYLR